MTGNSAAGRRLPTASLPVPEKWTLANGLTVLYLPARRSGLVVTAMCYRVGAADEPADRGGIAHFLEHLMFRGTADHPAGWIDRETHRAGGWNNAFTSHDSTLYLFGFSRESWRLAPAIEASRMGALDLAPLELEKERRVVLEEIAMYRDDPWESLELAVNERFFGRHPYGRPILGTSASVGELDGASLEAFHHDWYGPSRAVFAVAGDVERGEVEDAVEEYFGSIRPRRTPNGPADGAARPVGRRRIERRQGETGRFLLTMAAPAAADPAYAYLEVALAVLASGRSSRLQRRLVEELQLCSGVSAELSELAFPASASIAAEAMPGSEPGDIERVVMDEIERLRSDPPTAVEVERARSILLADWAFGHERVHQRAVSSVSAEALFGADYPQAHVRRLETADGHQVLESARQYLVPEVDSVVGWSLPRSGGGDQPC